MQNENGADHEKAREVAHETIVLLKNEADILPLKKGENMAFIGKYAQKPRYQGGGSSHINSKKVTSALDAIKQAGITNITFAKGYDDQIDAVDENSSSAEAITAEMNAAMEKFMPLRAVISFSDGKITPDQIEESVDKLNKLS